MAKNQVTHRADANHGRLLMFKNIQTGKAALSTNWLTGFSSMVFQSMYSVTLEEPYLVHKQAALDYLETLQILDPRIPRNVGAFREVTPQSKGCHPRDGLSAAWAFLCDYYHTQRRDSLERAELFANWLLTYGMKGDWPLCTVPLRSTVYSVFALLSETGKSAFPIPHTGYFA